MALMKTEHQQKKKEMIRLITVAQKINQQTFIENLCTLNAGHLNLNKMCFLPSGVHSPMKETVSRWAVKVPQQKLNRNRNNDIVTVIACGDTENQKF